MSVFVGTRLHSVVLATCAFVPSVMLEYRPKCRDYMLSIGQEDYVIRTDKFRSEEVWERACELNSERNRFSEALYQSIKPLRERQLRKASELQKAMLGD
jgi:polysaccharide pyruvyl transferase WcaK-like protein